MKRHQVSRSAPISASRPTTAKRSPRRQPRSAAISSGSTEAKAPPPASISIRALTAMDHTMLGPSGKSITPNALPGDAPNNCNAKLSGDRLRFCQEHGSDQIRLERPAQLAGAYRLEPERDALHLRRGSAEIRSALTSRAEPALTVRRVERHTGSLPLLPRGFPSGQICGRARQGPQRIVSADASSAPELPFRTEPRGSLTARERPQSAQPSHYSGDQRNPEDLPHTCRS